MTARTTIRLALGVLPLAAALLLGVAARGGDGVRGQARTNDPYAQALSWPAAQLRLPQVWAAAGVRQPTVIAVVDTGVSPVADVAPNLLPGVDLVNGDEDASDDNGHGTFIASIAAARTGNGIGIAGVCGTCSILPVKVLDSHEGGHASTVAEGIRWAVEHGAKVVNLSLGAPGDRPDLDAAIDDAIAQGVVVVVAAGNSGSSRPDGDGYPAAAVPNAIRVAATTSARKLAPWSNHGSWVDVSAPGWAVALRRNGTVAIGVQGTSYSAAYVSGLAGLLLSENPALTPAEVKQLVLEAGTRQAKLDVASHRIANVAASLAAATKTVLSTTP
jgi:subtilisin family serine protease